MVFIEHATLELANQDPAARSLHNRHPALMQRPLAAAPLARAETSLPLLQQSSYKRYWILPMMLRGRFVPLRVVQASMKITEPRARDGTSMQHLKGHQPKQENKK